ncbi:MAG: DEAD/DEAH box helicase [Candidatus Obscuribacterales bacterium]|nr:DEAD/DEAH box helicase [Candidatus Obscuribacterales bacterium]
MDDSSSGLQWAHPLVAEWITTRVGTLTDAQKDWCPKVADGSSVLISAPTGSGKTFSTFVVCIDSLVRAALNESLPQKPAVVYVSPLKALSNDVHKNLEVPLKEIVALANEKGLDLPPIKVALRTGDTAMSERRTQVTRPPHILVTTPESLYILLTSVKGQQMLSEVRTVIVDEIHAIADDKRGAHLALSLERLEALVGRPLARIGLSATASPLDALARFLGGSHRQPPTVVNVPDPRRTDVLIEVPNIPLAAVATNEMWDEVYDRITKLVEQNRSILVFVNTRKMSERIAHHLRERLGEEAVAAHHGSLSKKIRLSVEKKLKAGELKALVATASLELGIDIGYLDLVCQIGSPRAISTVLQRIGRAGHWMGATPKGRIFATTRDELIESAATIRAIHARKLDTIIIPEAPLDILAQQIVAACASQEWKEAKLFDLVKGAYPYKNLTITQFNEVLESLADGYAGRRGRFSAYLHRDSVNERVKGRRNARLAAITSGGAIPETALFTVVAEPEAKVIGSLDEDFAVESNRGDIILLGSTSWRIRRVEPRSGRVIVEDAHGAAPTVPFWRGEAPSRTDELSDQVSTIRAQIASLLQLPDGKRNAVQWCTAECGLDESGAEQLVQYIGDCVDALGAVPTKDTLIAERFFDESGAMQLVIHSPFGGRINKAWGLALRKRFCRSFNYELQAAATDNGINIALLEQHSFPLADVFHYVHPASVDDVLVQAALPTPLFETRWRWVANRSLAVLRFSGGRKVPPNLQRMRSQDLLASVFPAAAACQDNIEGDIPLPDHPLVNETIKDMLTDAMDVEGLKAMLAKIADGSIKCLAIDTTMPSPFSHEILNSNPYSYLDDAPLEERRARAVELRRVLPQSVAMEVGRLDPAAIEQVREGAWPDIRDADELADLLKTVVVMPEDLNWFGHKPATAWAEAFESLKLQNRVLRKERNGIFYWMPIERRNEFDVATGKTEIEGLDIVDAYTAAIGGWMLYLGPTTSQQLAATFHLESKYIDQAFLKLEARGEILRGTFALVGETEWCERRLLARIHRLTLGELRRQIRPVSAAEFYRWLFDWQHVAPNTQVMGERGTLEVISQLAGFEAPSSAWESEILARRIKMYDGSFLDRLCLTGAIGWGRLSPHPAFLSDAEKPEKSRITPSSSAPITFFLRDESDWIVLKTMERIDSAPLSHAAREVLGFLGQRGASFFADITRGAALLKSEIETALWELVSAGLVTADDFDNMRSLIDPRRRSLGGPRRSAGRWSLLQALENHDRQKTADAASKMLLKRYGVLFREVIARETNVPTWRELLMSLRRMEDRGEVRGGRFVSGFLGEQFALPLAVDSLRAFRKRQTPEMRYTVAATDPLNLGGILVPGDRIPATPGKLVCIVDGIQVVKA